jgi:hypothetical protein
MQPPDDDRGYAATDLKHCRRHLHLFWQQGDCFRFRVVAVAVAVAV